MTAKAAKVLKDAMNLPPADRADIASCLYGSLNGDDSTAFDTAWEKEIRRRQRDR